MQSLDSIFDEVVLYTRFEFGIWENKVHPAITKIGNRLFGSLRELCDDVVCGILKFLPFIYWDLFTRRICTQFMWAAVRNYRCVCVRGLQLS